MAAEGHRLEGEEEALFHTYPVYYVQSPSATSHANSSDAGRHEPALLSPFSHEEDSSFAAPAPGHRRSSSGSREAASRFALSRYSSSRGSNNSFLHDKKLPHCYESTALKVIGEHFHHVGAGAGGGEGEGGEWFGKSGRVWRVVALDRSSSWCCIGVQLGWRLLVSLALALLVFFLATRPPAPKVAFKIAGIRQFSLGEGLDDTGVITKILNCNCSVDMEVDNKSKLFGLHLLPTTMEMAFGRLKFASSQSEKEYVESGSSMTFQLYVGADDVPTYGAGRDMQDLLQSGRGLPLTIRMSSKSSYRVVWNLIRPRYRHHAECLLILDNRYDARRHSQIYNGTCSTITTHG